MLIFARWLLPPSCGYLIGHRRGQVGAPILASVTSLQGLRTVCSDISSIPPFYSNCLFLSASLLACSIYLTLSILALACISPKGSNRSLSGSLNGFCTQLPRSVNVVDRGRPARTSYALFNGGSTNGFGVGCGAATRDLLALEDTVSGRM
jgi:hypothetical protein